MTKAKRIKPVGTQQKQVAAQVPLQRVKTAPDSTTVGNAGVDLPDQADQVSEPRPTKSAQLSTMVRAPGGASLEALQAATGWQAHTIRAALTRLRQSGLSVERVRSEGETVYRCVSAGACASAGASVPVAPFTGAEGGAGPKQHDLPAPTAEE